MGPLPKAKRRNTFVSAVKLEMCEVSTRGRVRDLTRTSVLQRLLHREDGLELEGNTNTPSVWLLASVMFSIIAAVPTSSGNAARMRLGVTEHERECLKKLARRAKDARVLRRAQALLDLDAGESPRLVSRRYQVARSTIYNWVKRYRMLGLSNETLRDLPRPGRPRIAQKRD